MNKIDLSKCKKGDILISSQGSKLEYICPTPWKYLTYLDHVVRYIEDKDGNSMGDQNYGTRTNDGYTFLKNRKPESDHDIIKIIHMTPKDEKFKIEVCFSKNRHFPKFGPESYSIESHSVYFAYGKKFHFKSSKKAIEFIKNKITSEVLELFDSIYITKWKGYSGTTEILKDHKGKNDIYPINKELIEILFTF